MEENVVAPKSYKPVATILITLAVFFGSQLLGSLLVSLIPLGLGWSADQADSWLTNSPWAQFIFIVLVEALTIRLLWEFMRQRGMTFAQLGINKPKLKYISYALIGYVGYFLTYVVVLGIITALLPGFDVQKEQQLGFSKSTTGIELIPIFISLVILPPLVEEIVARGFLFRGLRSRLSYLTAALVTSLLFAAAHLPEAAEGLLWIAAVDTFILSMVMCHLREKTGSLWAPIGVHFIKNGIAFVVLFNIVQYFR